MFKRIALLAGLAAVAACTGAVIANAAAAHADADQDACYLAVPHSEQIVINNPAGAISDAHVVCNKFTAGESFTEVLSELRSAATGLTQFDAGYDIGAAVGVYCGQHLDLLPNTGPQEPTRPTQCLTPDTDLQRMR